MSEIKITASGPVPDDTKKSLEAKLYEKFGSDAKITYEVDKSLIGGFTCAVNGKLYDVSIKSMLGGMRALFDE